MATIITHGLAASFLSTVGPSTVPRLRLTLLLGTLAMVPDLDVIGYYYGVAYSDMLGHRGFTHSIAFASVVGLIAPKIFFPAARLLHRDWLILVMLCFSATLSHGLMDAFTDAGLGVGFLIPFDDTRFFAPWRPIPTSPLSVRAFFDGAASSILTSEFFWVGIPTVSGFGALCALRRRGRRRDV